MHQSCHVVLESSSVGGRVCWCCFGDMLPRTNPLRPLHCLLVPVCVLPHAPHSWHGIHRLWLQLSLIQTSSMLLSCLCFHSFVSPGYVMTKVLHISYISYSLTSVCAHLYENNSIASESEAFTQRMPKSAGCSCINIHF